jgi:hypothetical protein
MHITRRALLGSMACFVARQSAASESLRERKFELQYEAALANIPAGAEHLRFWMPVAHADAFQKIELLDVEAGYHCRAECFAPGNGWFPVDASEAAKDPSRREYFFGALDENRVEFSRGRDLVLNPPQQGEPLNYFVFPYAEIDGKPRAGIETMVSYRDLV